MTFKKHNNVRLKMGLDLYFTAINSYCGNMSPYLHGFLIQRIWNTLQKASGDLLDKLLSEYEQNL